MLLTVKGRYLVSDGETKTRRRLANVTISAKQQFQDNFWTDCHFREEKNTLIDSECITSSSLIFLS